MSGGRRRPLRPEERRLWAEVARSVEPLPGRIAPAAPEPAPGAEPAPAAGLPAAGSPAAGLPSGSAVPARPAAPPLLPLERKTARALARGRLAADATLDLHGLTQAEAHARLGAFLRGARARGDGLVLVITGRGKAGFGEERGVLRRTVPHWLRLPEMRELVIGFTEAGTRQGGAGALYVRLRRPRLRG